MPILGARGGASSRGLGQFTGSPTAPTSPVTGYHLWLDAANAASFTYSSGSVVSQWTDRSANAFTFTTAGTTNQPSRSGTQNGKSTVLFDGSNDYLLSTAAKSTWKYLHDGTQTTVFFVVKANETSGSSNWVFSTGGFENGAKLQLDYSGSPATAAYTVQSTFPGYVMNYGITIPSGHNIYTYKVDVNNSTNSNKMTAYRNAGASQGSILVSSWSAPSTTDPYSSLYLGTGYGGSFTDGTYPEYMFSGEIAEIIVYKSLLSDSDRIANVNYLRAKWGI